MNDISAHIDRCVSSAKEHIDAMKNLAVKEQNPFLHHAMLLGYFQLIYKELVKMLLADRHAFYGSTVTERAPEEVLERLLATHVAIGNSVCHLHAVIHNDLEALTEFLGRDDMLRALPVDKTSCH